MPFVGIDDDVAVITAAANARLIDHDALNDDHRAALDALIERITAHEGDTTHH